MKLRSKDGNEFELNITGYEPALMEETWLNISIRVKSEKGNWQETSHCLMVFEIKLLYEWFLDIVNGKVVNNELDFTEPNLKFKIIESDIESVHLRIYFQLEYRPPWIDQYEGEFWIDMVVAPLEFKIAAEDLKSQLPLIKRLFSKTSKKNKDNNCAPEPAPSR